MQAARHDDDDYDDEVLLCFNNNSTKHLSFVYTELNDQTVLFLTIRFSMSIKLYSSKLCSVSLTIQLNIT